VISGLSVKLNEEFMIRWELNNEWSRFDCMPDLQRSEFDLYLTRMKGEEQVGISQQYVFFSRPAYCFIMTIKKKNSEKNSQIKMHE